MLYAYHGPLDAPTWRLAVPQNGTLVDYIFAPTETRPGGFVRFTSRRRVQVFLAYHRERWGALDGARLQRDELTLGELLRAARHRYLDHPEEAPLLFQLVYVDPRPPFGAGGELDAEVLRLVPPHLPGPFTLPLYNRATTP